MDTVPRDIEQDTMIQRANIDGALAEFGTLRAEALSRLSTMQTVLTLQITVAGAIFSVALSSAGRNAVVLAIPFTSCVLALRYVGQNVSLRNISTYIQDYLSDRVPGGLGWERWVNARRPRIRALGWAGPLIVSFPGISLVALTWFAVTYLTAVRVPQWNNDAGLLVLWGIGLVVTVFTYWLVQSTFMWRLLRDTRPQREPSKADG